MAVAHGHASPVEITICASTSLCTNIGFMKGTGVLRLGPVARKLLDTDKWRGDYPAWPAYSRELDELLHFANLNGYLGRFIRNLESKDRQRDKALSELRLAYMFRHLEFGIP